MSGDVADPAVAVALAQWLRDATRANSVAIERYARLSGGAIQDNWSLDVVIDGGALHGEHRYVLRTDAPSTVASSLTRAQEFAVLRVAHAAGVATPEPLLLCTDPRVLGRTFFVMERLAGVAQAHRLTREPALVPDAKALVRSLGANLARMLQAGIHWSSLSGLANLPAGG